MSEADMRSYFERRLSNCQTDNVPDFDSFFKEGELISPKSHIDTSDPHIVEPKPHVSMWPWLTAALSVAAAGALLFVFVGKEDPAGSVPVADNQQTVEILEAPIVEPEILAAESSAAESSAAESFETGYSEVEAPAAKSPVAKTAKNAEASEPIKVSPSEDLYAADYVPEEKDVSEPIEEKSQQIQTPPRQYERTIAEANATAAANVKANRKDSRRKMSITASFNQDNSLLASSEGVNYQQTTVSMITRSYQSSAAAIGASTLRAASVVKNEWTVPGNLEKNTIASYTPKYNLPLTAGVGVAIPLFGRFDLQTGLTYSYLSANTVGTLDDGASFSLYQGLHYLGLPLRLSYRILDKRWGLYVSAGGGIEKGLAGEQDAIVKDASGKITSAEYLNQLVEGVQPYAGAQIGLSYNFARQFQLYVEPGISYYFDAEQPISSRTDNPLSFSLGLGLRFLTK